MDALEEELLELLGSADEGMAVTAANTLARFYHFKCLRIGGRFLHSAWCERSGETR